MPQGLFGRTNLEFPPVWLSLSACRAGDDAGALVGAAVESGVPIDVTSMPALWGGHMRGTDACLTCVSNSDFERATDDKHASDLIQAHLIETLSCVGRDYFDFYFLRIRRAVEEYQIAGALEAMEMARQEGHIRFMGICCDGPSLSTLGTWQFRDAFDALLVPRNHYDPEPYETLAPMARERRVGVVTSRPLNWGYGLPFVDLPSQWRLRNLTKSFYGQSLAQAVIGELSQDAPVMVGVRSAKEVVEAIEAPSKRRPDGLREFLQPFVEAWDSEETWEAPELSVAATRRSREAR